MPPFPAPEGAFAQAASTLEPLMRRSLSSSRSSMMLHLDRLLRRQNQNSDCSVVATCYGNINDGPSGGTVVGIVLGSVGGFLLLLYLLYTCLNFSRGPSSGSSYAPTESTHVRSRRGGSSRRTKSQAHSHRSRHNSFIAETSEVRRGPSPARGPPAPYPAPQPPMAAPMPMPQYREREIIEERSVHRSVHEPDFDGSEEVVVIEEHDSSPPRRSSKSKATSRRGSRDDNYDSGYRTVDPERYAGVVGGGKRDRSSRRDR